MITFNATPVSRNPQFGLFNRKKKEPLKNGTVSVNGIEIKMNNAEKQQMEHDLNQIIKELDNYTITSFDANETWIKAYGKSSENTNPEISSWLYLLSSSSLIVNISRQNGKKVIYQFEVNADYADEPNTTGTPIEQLHTKVAQKTTLQTHREYWDL